MSNQTGYTISYVTEEAHRNHPAKLGDRLRFPMENVGKTTGRTRNFRQSEVFQNFHIFNFISFHLIEERRILNINTYNMYMKYKNAEPNAKKQ
jgi:hypothetical protein